MTVSSCVYFNYILYTILHNQNSLLEANDFAVKFSQKAHFGEEYNIHGLLAKRQVEMAGYWPSGPERSRGP